MIAQLLDYASCIAGWSYAELDAAFQISERPENDAHDQTIWQRVAGQSELDEASFVDAVSRNLCLGRFLCLIVGDGIRESAEALAEFLQGHAGLHFTMALVELSVWRLSPDNVIVIPRVPLRTVTIERGVVAISSGRAVVAPPPPDPPPVTLTEELFYEEIGKIDPSTPSRLRQFLSQIRPLGISHEMKKTLMLGWHAPNGDSFNLGYVQTNGHVWFDIIHGKARSIGLGRISYAYLESLAKAIGGHVQKTRDWSLKLGDSAPPISALLDHDDAWVEAIRRFVASMADALRESSV